MPWDFWRDGSCLFITKIRSQSIQNMCGETARTGEKQHYEFMPVVLIIKAFRCTYNFPCRNIVTSVNVTLVEKG